MAMVNDQQYFSPITDMRFLLHEVLGVERLYEAHGIDRELVDGILDAAARLTGEVVSPLNPVADREGCRLENGRVYTPSGYDAAWARFVEGGWPGLSLPIEHGGQGMPFALQAAFAEMINGACPAFAMMPCSTRATATALIAAGDDWMRETVVPRLAAGEWSGTISMTEAGAGSDVGRVSVRAEPLGDGRYAVSGAKMFISYGDHDLTEQIIHMVIARVPGAPGGIRGLSLFMVPSRRIDDDGAPGPANGVSVTRIENKMGLHGSPTCELAFNEAEGFLVGEEGRGINGIFHMVNTMRLEVACQGPAAAGAVLHKSFEYAAEREQFGAPIGEHPDVRRMLMTMKAWTEGVRALVFEAAVCLDLARAGADDARDMADWLLPVCKRIGSERGFEVANLAIQIHGGHGYVTETGVEQYARDSRVATIYEGTSGIQAIDTLTRKLARDDGRRYRVFVERIRTDLEQISGVAEIADAVRDGLAMLEDCTGRIVSMLTDTPRDALAGASAYQQLVGTVGVGWIWLRMAAVGDETKRATARYFARHMMPDCARLAEEALAGSDDLFEAPLDRLAPN